MAIWIRLHRPVLANIRKGDTIRFIDAPGQPIRKVVDVSHPDPHTTTVELDESGGFL